MAFGDVPGNARVKKILRISLQRDRLPNSLLFCGPGGVGKRETALILAMALNCENLRKDDACGECGPCRAVAGGRHPDVLEIRPKNNHIGIDDMRFLREAAYLRPMIGRKRVFIVDESDKMGEEASNAVLKILEEPPRFSHIILITDDAHLILPTIRSRCQVLTFSPLDREEVRTALREKGFSEERAEAMSLLVKGNLEQAMSLDWDDIQARRRESWETLLAFGGGRNASRFLESYAFSTREAVEKDFRALLELLSTFLRDLILIKENGNPRFLFNPDFREELPRAAEDWTMERLWATLGYIDDALSALDKNLNMRLLVSAFYSHIEDWNYART